MSNNMMNEFDKLANEVSYNEAPIAEVFDANQYVAVEPVGQGMDMSSVAVNGMYGVTTAKGATLSPEIILSNLDEREKSKAVAIKNAIDISKQETVMNFGVNVQSRLDDSANTLLSKSTGGEDEAINAMLNEMMTSINEVMPEDIEKAKAKGLFPWIRKKAMKKALELKTKTQTISTTLDQFKGQLSGHRSKIMADNQMLDNMLANSRDYFQELNVVIAGGQLKLQELDNEIIPAKQAEYQQTKDPQVGQELMELNTIRNDLSIRIDDLVRAQDIALTQSYQILILKSGNNVLAKKLDNSVRIVLPMWKSQIAMSLTLLKTEQALAAQDMVYETTDKLLKGVSEGVKDAALSIAEANNKSIVSIERLKENHKNLLDTVQGVIQINNEGEKKRIEAQAELHRAQLNLVQTMGQLETGNK